MYSQDDETQTEISTTGLERNVHITYSLAACRLSTLYVTIRQPVHIICSIKEQARPQTKTEENSLVIPFMNTKKN